MEKKVCGENLAADQDWWLQFLSYYVRVIQDCALRCLDSALLHTGEVIARFIDVKKEVADAIGCKLVIEWCWRSKRTGIETVRQVFL